MTGDKKRLRAENAGLAAVIVGAMSMALPWWAWRRRRNMMHEATTLMEAADVIGREVSHG